MISQARKTIRVSGLVCAVTVALALTPAAQGQKTARAKALGDRVMCMCGGCNDAAAKCNHMGGNFAGPCETAQAELKEIDDRIAQGQSDDLILQEFVQEYGPTVLLSPPAKGFDLLAWVMPVAMLIAGLLLVWMIVSRWRRRVAVAGGGPQVPVDLLARARREMGDEDE
jgi:cytochrome c-type biogenesis protein CcmH/NrfF